MFIIPKIETTVQIINFEPPKKVQCLYCEGDSLSGQGEIEITEKHKPILKLCNLGECHSVSILSCKRCHHSFIIAIRAREFVAVPIDLFKEVIE